MEREREREREREQTSHVLDDKINENLFVTVAMVHDI